LFRTDGHKDLNILRAHRASDTLAETKFRTEFGEMYLPMHWESSSLSLQE
jgi:hypothetical protein